MARTGTDLGNGNCGAGILSGTFTQGEGLREEYPCWVLELVDADVDCSNRLRYLPQVSHHERIPWEDSEGGCCWTRNCGKAYASCCLGADALWWNHSFRVLPG